VQANTKKNSRSLAISKVVCREWEKLRVGRLRRRGERWGDSEKGTAQMFQVSYDSVRGEWGADQENEIAARQKV
jgi:hypothetical protein